jgi:hypothetical protein
LMQQHRQMQPSNLSSRSLQERAQAFSKTGSLALQSRLLTAKAHLLSKPRQSTTAWSLCRPPLQSCCRRRASCRGCRLLHAPSYCMMSLAPGHLQAKQSPRTASRRQSLSRTKLHQTRRSCQTQSGAPTHLLTRSTASSANRAT